MSSPESISPAGRNLLDRRQFLAHTGTGLGGIALSWLLNTDRLLASPASRGPIRPLINPASPHAPRRAHMTPAAKRIVVIFCSGAISHVDTWDFKPDLVRMHGKPIPGSNKLVTFQGEQGALTAPLYPFKPRGQSGKMMSDLIPHIAQHADDLCFIHSMTSKTNTHGPGENFMSTGDILEGFPSMGAWVTYALGSEADDLPSFVAIPDPRGVPQSSINNWGAGFLPAVFQGTPFNASRPIRNLSIPKGVSAADDLAARRALAAFNAQHLQRHPGDSELAARIASYELAAKMQMSVPEVTDLSSEPAHIRRMYGADDSSNATKQGFARNCMLARRLLERGVRFVQLFNGAYAMGEGVGNWDGHKHLAKQYAIHGPILDQPVGALIGDLKQRGMLEDTLVVLCSEFGRMPTFQKGASGRDHNPEGFTCMLAGAGVKAPFTFGATDPFGYKAVENVTSVYEFHATILRLLGLDFNRLSYYHNGFERKLTNVHGRVIEDVLS
ncbi:DUF1501 domain-containing protein [Planctomycetales bacterium ZRK34]|nr:DUF1501 domain-containing protein [Planctomycetales bacterium ZRK34]